MFGRVHCAVNDNSKPNGRVRKAGFLSGLSQIQEDEMAEPEIIVLISDGITIGEIVSFRYVADGYLSLILSKNSEEGYSKILDDFFKGWPIKLTFKYGDHPLEINALRIRSITPNSNKTMTVEMELASGV
jgi:hypothetical protein